MKKLLLTAALLGGAFIANAQLSFVYNGEVVPNGATIEYYTYDQFPVTNTLDQISFAPIIYLQSASAANVNVSWNATESIDICIGGGCVSGKVNEKSNLPFKAGEQQDLLLEYWLETNSGATPVIPQCSATIKAAYADGSGEVVITVVMGGENSVNAGVNSVSADVNKISVSGKSLKYTVDKASKLSVFSLSGRTVIERQVSGTGSISLENLPGGVYLYRLNGNKVKAGKFVIK